MTAKKKEKEAVKNDAVLPERRAEIRHTDHGYAVAIVDGDNPPSGSEHQRLEGLYERINDLKKAGYKVSLEGPLPDQYKEV